jgi:alkylation response protein AidB-like acyl-CoA dehydrogenase
MYLADLRSDSVTRNRVETVDPTRDSAGLTFVDCEADLLGSTGAGWEQLERLYDRAAVLLAFEQLGGAQSALNMAVAYAQERFAFGRPIGSFQALKHMMADMYVALKLAESNCYYAAWALATDAADLPLAAATARVSATQAYQLCSRDNIQVHGGMGFTWEFDCHLYYRRSNYLALQLGGLTTWENKLVDALPRGAAAA